VIPIAIVLASIGGYTGGGNYGGGEAPTIAIGGTGLLFLPPLLMIVSGRSTHAGGSTGTWSCCASPTASAPTSHS
jgi:hypothetical protein